MPKVTAKKLQKQWNVEAKHVLYRKDGRWYHQLNRFPGALFDANGFIIFRTSTEYENCSYLNISLDADQLHVPLGIAAIPGYVLFKKSDSATNELASPQRNPQIINRIIRDTALGQQIKALYGYKCQICGEVIKLKNNEVYAEAHHIKPLGTPHNGPDIFENILCLCPNHHVQLDYGAIKIDRMKIYQHPDHKISDEFVKYHNNFLAK